MGKLTGKVALVTAAARNIGKAIALEYAREGADLALATGSRREQLESVAAECRKEGSRVCTVVGDLSDPGTAKSLVEQSLSVLRRIDILVNTVGERPSIPMLKIGLDEWHRHFAINLHSTFYLAQAVLPGMVERRSGAIIVLGGLGGVVTTRPWKTGDKTHLIASKAGQFGLIRGIALEFGPYGIRANAIEPGPTEVLREHPEWYPLVSGPPEQAMGKLTALGRPAKVTEIARIAVFLASDDASWVTGTMIFGGGTVMH